MYFKYFTLFLVLIIPFNFNNAQNSLPSKKQIEIVNANIIEFNKDVNSNAKRLIGNVQFKQGNVLMFCDSAHFYSETNFIDAFSNIGIHQGDTLHLYGNLLKYDGNARLAQMRENVKLIDKDIELTTNNLDYNIINEVGYYFDGGNIVNKENKLKSFSGHYYSREKTFYFHKNVVITNPKYVIKSDTLKYKTTTRTSYFFGPSEIISKENYIYCENGWYNSITNKSSFSKNAYLKNKSQLLKGDSLFYDRNKGIGKAWRNIFLIDSVQNMIVTGNYAYYTNKPQFVLITDSAVFMYYNAIDTLFIHADTLWSLTDSITLHRHVKCYKHVKIFKPDLQGKCDTLTYNTADSTMQLFGKPVLWNNQNQISAQHIKLFMANQKPKQTEMTGFPFIIQEIDTGKYNQIKGKLMKGYFKNNQLNKVEVLGNGQTIYYASDNNNPLGINKAESANLDIYLENKKISRINMKTKPDATMIPLQLTTPEDIKLKGFKWYSKQRPLNRFDIFRWENE